MADTLLITWPYVSLLYFTKIGVPWEYATVAGESAQAFACFMEAERRAWRTAQHADHRLWMHLFILSMRRPDPRRRPSPSKRYMMCMFHVGASMHLHVKSIDVCYQRAHYRIFTECNWLFLYLWFNGIETHTQTQTHTLRLWNTASSKKQFGCGKKYY